jgi:hypothetical protein
MQTLNEALEARMPTQAVPTVSAVFKSGGVLEMVYDPDAHQDTFCVLAERFLDF